MRLVGLLKTARRRSAGATAVVANRQRVLAETDSR
jgi:hypothetical protein